MICSRIFRYSKLIAETRLLTPASPQSRPRSHLARPGRHRAAPPRSWRQPRLGVGEAQVNPFAPAGEEGATPSTTRKKHTCQRWICRPPTLPAPAPTPGPSPSPGPSPAAGPAACTSRWRHPGASSRRGRAAPSTMLSMSGLSPGWFTAGLNSSPPGGICLCLSRQESRMRNRRSHHHLHPRS